MPTNQSLLLSQIENLYHNNNNRTEIQRVRASLCAADNFFASTEQQDAHEALLKILNILEVQSRINLFDDQPSLTPVYSSIIHKTFYGTLK